VRYLFFGPCSPCSQFWRLSFLVFQAIANRLQRRHDPTFDRFDDLNSTACELRTREDGAKARAPKRTDEPYLQGSHYLLDANGIALGPVRIGPTCGRSTGHQVRACGPTGTGFSPVVPRTERYCLPRGVRDNRIICERFFPNNSLVKELRPALVWLGHRGRW